MLLNIVIRLIKHLHLFLISKLLDHVVKFINVKVKTFILVFLLSFENLCFLVEVYIDLVSVHLKQLNLISFFWSILDNINMNLVFNNVADFEITWVQSDDGFTIGFDFDTEHDALRMFICYGWDFWECFAFKLVA